jgi:D-alanyl-D-alanine carboxypeptidase (penicillin-binding protein 5/6)
MQKLLKKRSGSRLSRVKTRRLATALLVLFVLYIGWAFVAVPTSAFAGTEVSLPASTSQASTASVAWPGAKEAAVGTAEYGTLASNGAQTPVPIASVAKVMIALAILRERPFDKGEQGDMLTLTQQALMLPSANNIADTLAIWAFGSVDAYTDYANSYANTLGMKSTHFADASGYDPATVSSAVDLVKLGQRAMQNAVISDIVSQETATIPVAGTIRNVNRLLDDGDGFVGIKTGNTDQAGGCLLFAAIYPKGDQTVTIIGAVLGSSDLTQALRDSSGLLASAKGNFVESTAIKKGTVVGTYALPWGERVSARSDNDINALTWRGTNVTTQIALSSVHVPATSGQDVGKVVERGSSVGSSKTVPITLNQAIEGPSLWWRVMHPVDTWHFRFG